MSTKIITITIEECTDDRLPLSERFLAYISEGEYKATVVTGESLPDVLKEIGISMMVKDDYTRRKQIQKKFE